MKLEQGDARCPKITDKMPTHFKVSTHWVLSGEITLLLKAVLADT